MPTTTTACSAYAQNNQLEFITLKANCTIYPWAVQTGEPRRSSYEVPITGVDVIKIAPEKIKEAIRKAVG